MASSQILFQWNTSDVLNGTRSLHGNLKLDSEISGLCCLDSDEIMPLLLGLNRQLFRLFNLDEFLASQK
jgi:hypothetical protein